MLGGGDRGGAGARKHDADFFNFLADDLECVQQGRARNDCCPVLVIVEDGNPHRLPQRLLDVKTVGRSDVLEIDSADGWLEQLAELDHVVWVLRSHLEIEDIEVGELLEQIALALHDRLACQCSNVAESEHGGAVGHDCDQVAFGRVSIRVFRIGLDLEAGQRHSGGVGECEIALVVEGLGRYYRDLSGASGCVVVKGIFTLHGTWKNATRAI